jgi:phage gpG-like protein
MSSWLRFDFSSSKLDGWREELQSKASRLHEVLFAKVSALTYQLQTKVIGKLSGQVLKVETGTLRSSVTANTSTDGTVITGTVEAGKGPSHSYAMIHTMGHEGAYKIMASKSRVLAWQTSVKEKAFAYFVTHPPIPAKPFMADTLNESREQIRNELAQAVADVLLNKR